MTVIEFSCPSCTAILRTANEKLLGKKIRCPKCSSPCPVPAAKKPALVASEIAVSSSYTADDNLPEEFSFESSELSERTQAPEPNSETKSAKDYLPATHSEPEINTGGIPEMTPTVPESQLAPEIFPPAQPMTVGGFVLSTVLFLIWAVVVGLASYALVNLDLTRDSGKTTSSLNLPTQESHLLS